MANRMDSLRLVLMETLKDKSDEVKRMIDVVDIVKFLIYGYKLNPAGCFLKFKSTSKIIDPI